jgi:hypothetical protein
MMECSCSARLLWVEYVRNGPGQTGKQTYKTRPREGKQSRKTHDHSHNPQPVRCPDREVAFCKGWIDVNRIDHCGGVEMRSEVVK